MGLETTRDGALVADDGSVERVLWTIGPPRRGNLWETTAIPEIRLQAAALAEELAHLGSPAVVSP